MIIIIFNYFDVNRNNCRNEIKKILTATSFIFLEVKKSKLKIINTSYAKEERIGPCARTVRTDMWCQCH